MSVFTDEDLKIFKAHAEEDFVQRSIDMRDLLPLLSRLEAAEVLATDELIENGMAYDDPKLLAWRKAAGKSKGEL